VLGEGQRTPAPWINVISNASFGFQVSVEGGGYTWSGNSRQHQLTPWSNDPVGDRPGEVIYLRDEDSGEVWGPTALPIRDERSSYLAAHGQGYSRFEHSAHEVDLHLLQFVPEHDTVKVSRLTIRNRSARKRRLTVTVYAEWVLGAARDHAAPFVATETDSASRALLARNPWSAEFGGRVAFLDMGGKQEACTGDRTEFLGRNGTLARPLALSRRVPLSDWTGAGRDPCGVLQAPVTLEADGACEIVVTLGEAATRAEALVLVERYRSADLDASLGAVTRAWDAILGTVQVTTPDRSMDLLLNRWLLYQTRSCRLLARSAFYQSSGAYGLRDQLQDGMAMTLACPEATRRHLLRAASRQFLEGDTQHWWLPPSGQGVRTRISDDRVWLAHAAAHYVRVSGDTAVLDEKVPFLEGASLHAGEDDSFFQPMVAEETASLFEHCARALDGALETGSHGLPLMGGGDWNDGMNRVGALGRGESVWLGWLLHPTLLAMASLAVARGETGRALRWTDHAETLRRSLEREAWDGAWYRRGYFDDGTPLGSASSEECRIDSIAQSWAVISGAADPVRAAAAMEAVHDRLVRRDAGLVLLFTPPFDRTPLDPGYIKGYPPGIRENGGQYTHAAAWTVIATAMLGDGDRAAALWSILNPIHRSATRVLAHRYKVEPYVTSADVYSEPPHSGRGGWTWYTGSAGWLYRAGLESLLGFRVEGDTLTIDPCIPKAWAEYEIRYRYGATNYEIRVENPNGVCRGISKAELDGVLTEGPGASLRLVDDGATHRVRVLLAGEPPSRQ
jgi:cyclic beta-1,2-glucan synthetase